MIKLPNLDLAAPLESELSSFQSEIDAVSNFDERVKKARSMWSNKSDKDNRIFQAVRARLEEMCYGIHACGYCEDSLAHEIEHIRPKTFYPENTFLWTNYLLACGRCNRAKLDKWAVYPEATGPYVELKRTKPPRVPPIPGEQVFLDPRGFDPFQHIRIDIPNTFQLLPRAPIGTRRNDKARYTIKVLALNDPPLVRRRNGAYGRFVDILEKYAHKLQEGVPESDLQHLVAAFQTVGHPFVWEEMKRSRSNIPELQEVFAHVPQALDWSLHLSSPNR